MNYNVNKSNIVNGQIVQFSANAMLPAFSINIRLARSLSSFHSSEIN